MLKFTERVHIIKENLLPIPPLFRIIKEQSGTDAKEMYKVFNMGHRLEIYTDAATAGEMIAVSKSMGIEAQIIGRVEASETNRLTVRSSWGEFNYE